MPGALPRFAFLVHPLTAFHRRVVGVRRMDLRMALGPRGGGGEPGVLCELGIEGVARGVVIAVPTLPGALLDDQEAALEAMVRAVAVAERHLGGLDAVGLGSLLAVVAGRGVALSERVAVPVTTGAAATSWAAVGNTAVVLEAAGEDRVAVLGFAGAVGSAVAEALAARGYRVCVGGTGRALARRARRLGLAIAAPAEAAAGHRIVVGASTTGGILDPGELAPGSVLLDIAMPPTLRSGRRPAGLSVLAGEAADLPPGWRRGFWGSVYHLLAGYGPGQIFACLAEPIVMAAAGRRRPYALGRRVDPADLADFTRDAEALSLRPRLVRGWRQVRPAELLGRPLLP